MALVREDRRERERAFRLEGEERVRMRMCPVCGAGMSVVVRRGREGWSRRGGGGEEGDGGGGAARGGEGVGETGWLLVRALL